MKPTVSAPEKIGTSQDFDLSSGAGVMININFNLGKDTERGKLKDRSELMPQIAVIEELSPYSRIASDPESEAVEIDFDYSTRVGYEVDFLSKPPIPLPMLGANVIGEPATNRQTGEYELPYHHFSIVMNRIRRFAFFTAVNIDGKQYQPLDREKDRWVLDSRLDESEQVGESLYKNNDLDRGHLVRRLDPCWGVTELQRVAATSDTFHFTNCSPQHAKFNQNQGTWAGLENYILSNVSDERMRVTVFTGPVFSKTDPVYRGIKLPKQFWKVVAFIKPDGLLGTSAYLLSQKSLIET